MNRRVRRGFTLVEVSLFLAVTGLLFIGIVAGVQGSMSQQRYNDSVQSFAEFLRSTYSQVMNVENSKGSGGGQTNQAVYGKLIVFGESQDFQGNNNDDRAAYVYTVVGEAKFESNSGSSVIEALKDAKANVIVGQSDGKINFAGIAEQYITRWGAEIQTTDGWNNGYRPFRGAVLIVRHPNSGTVFTYVYKGGEKLSDKLEINKLVSESSQRIDPIASIGNEFKVEDVDFCINPDGNRKGERRDIRIVAGARNSSGVEVIAQDGKENRCGN